MAKTFHCYEDPGHAWLKVSLEDILKVGLMPSAFSSYSYRNGDSFSWRRTVIGLDSLNNGRNAIKTKRSSNLIILRAIARFAVTIESNNQGRAMRLSQPWRLDQCKH